MGFESIMSNESSIEQTLYLQNNVEEVPPYHVEHHRYSAKPLYSHVGDVEQNPSIYPPGANAMSRRNSHLDSHFDGILPPPSSGTAFTPQNEPSLVSQLKFAQGLIKKKQHSKDPQPAPFIADARVQDSSSLSYPIIPPSTTPPSSASSSSSASTLASTSPPTSATSAVPLSSVPLTSRHRKPQSLAMAGFSNAPPDTILGPTNGGRAMSLSKADRMQRVSQASSGSSPTELVHGHMRRGSQVQMQGVMGSNMNVSGQGGSPGAWFAANSHGLPQQMHAQRGSRLSTPDQDMPMSSPALSAGSLGPGSANGTVIGTSSSTGGRGAALDTGIGGSNIGSEVVAPDGSAPSIGVGMTNGSGNHDISPGSVSSYVSSDMSSPTTPGSTEDLSSYARMQALYHQGVTYQISYQQNGVGAGSQDSLLSQRQQMQQMQEMQLLQHQEHVPQLHQAAAVQQSHFYPGEFDPSSNYFPAQPTVPSQQYYLPQQPAPTQQPVDESVYQPGLSGSAMAEPIQDVQTQQSSLSLHCRPAIRQPQTVRHNSYPNTRPTVNASPPPMIVPSQSHVPLTIVNQTNVAAPAMDTTVIQRSSPPRPPLTRTSTGPQAQGRTRASTVTASSNLKNSSPSKIAKSKRHKKSASSVSHSAFVQSIIDPQISSSAAPLSGGDEVYRMSPLYAASTGVLFESMFNIKSGLLDGPAALANPEDVALVAPALGLGEGPNVLAKLPVGTVETAGGLFRSRLKERGGVVDEFSGTALVPVPAATVVTGSLHGDNPVATGVGQSVPSVTASGDMSAFVDATTSSMSQPTYPSAGYPYEGQHVPYGTSNGLPNCQ